MPPKYFKKKGAKPKAKPRRRLRRGGGVSTAAVKRIVNSMTARKAESKIYGTAIWDQFCGQVDNDGAGYLTLDLTPLMNSGSGSTQRVGNAIDWVSAHYQFQIMEQSNATNTDVSFKFMLIHDKCPENNVYTTEDDNNPIQAMYNRNNFIRTSTGGEAQIRDYSSPRDINNMSRFKILATKKIFMRGDQFLNAKNRIRTFEMGLKFKKPMKQKYDGAGMANYIPSSAGNVFLCVYCNSGNIGDVLSTLDGIPRDAAESGYLISMNNKSYFKDY